MSEKSANESQQQLPEDATREVSVDVDQAAKLTALLNHFGVRVKMIEARDSIDGTTFEIEADVFSASGWNRLEEAIDRD
jgi:N-dimethylarginine dimethylaminohydrolase